jgi:hypothetical protein
MIKKTGLGHALEAHACNPGYSEGRDQETHILRPAQATKDPISILNTHKKSLVE